MKTINLFGDFQKHDGLVLLNFLNIITFLDKTILNA